MSCWNEDCKAQAEKWRQARAFFLQLVVLVLLGWIALALVSFWRWALDPPALAAGSMHAHAWRVEGRVREADHITTSAPDYMGGHGFVIAGHDEDGRVIWSASGVTEYEQVR